jgi:DNA-binding MarR family transcriptional regulator
MNYSASEISNTRNDDTVLIEAATELLPAIARGFFSAITTLGNAYGLTPAQVKVLLNLEAGRRMTVGEIAAALGCSMPAASELVDRLVEAGHLLRGTDPADRRRVLLTATPEAERISAQLHALREAQIRYALEQLPLEERPIFVKSLLALLAGLTRVSGGAETACPSPETAR